MRNVWKDELDAGIQNQVLVISRGNCVKLISAKFWDYTSNRMRKNNFCFRWSIIYALVQSGCRDSEILLHCLVFYHLIVIFYRYSYLSRRSVYLFILGDPWGSDQNERFYSLFSPCPSQRFPIERKFLLPLIEKKKRAQPLLIVPTAWRLFTCCWVHVYHLKVCDHSLHDRHLLLLH